MEQLNWDIDNENDSNWDTETEIQLEWDVG